jgi:hypothetical protein
MHYISAPEPADDVVIVPQTGDMPAFTWGDHRAMLRQLEEMESENPMVLKARERLQRYLVENNWLEDGPKRLICAKCGRSPEQPHEEECEYRPARPEEMVQREAHGYEYYSDRFEPVHMTSVPMDDEEALDYFRIIDAIRFTEDIRVQYVYKRAWGESEYKMMPYQFNRETGQVLPIETSRKGF